MAQTRDPRCPGQPHLVSEGKLTCQRGSWEVAATAAYDPKETSTMQPVAMQRLDQRWV